MFPCQVADPAFLIRGGGRRWRAEVGGGEGGANSEIFLTDLRKMLKKKLAFCIIKNLLKFSGFTFYHCVLIITRN